MLMTTEAAYRAWAPPSSPWSPWVKPITFAQHSLPPHVRQRPEPQWLPSLDWVPRSSDGVALVLDLPGAHAVRSGIDLLKLGYHPVPLFNATDGPNPVLDLAPIERALFEGVDDIAAVTFHDRTPPAFLLDSRRLSGKRPGPGRYDNRWIVFPQDFPSSAMLQAHGINAVLVVRQDHRPPESDLRQVLLRWHKAGIQLLGKQLGSPKRAAPLPVPWAPMSALALFFAGMTLGLRRNSAGGFGSIVPMPNSGGSGGYRGFA